MKTYKLGFSTCPNDTFIMYAIAHKSINMRGLQFDIQLLDIENLNQSVLNQKLDFSKASSAIIPKVKENYYLLNSGSAFGLEGGPLLVGQNTYDSKVKPLIALPGENTTANLLFNKLYKKNHEKKFVVFSEIFNLLANKDVDAGVIIHEDRFTYQALGLKCILDLGQKWHNETQLPVPLGSFFAHNSIDKQIINEFANLIVDSIKYSQSNYSKVFSWIKDLAKNKNENIIKEHIDYYVNELTLALNQNAENSLSLLLSNELNSLFLQKEDNFYKVKSINR